MEYIEKLRKAYELKVTQQDQTLSQLQSRLHALRAANANALETQEYDALSQERQLANTIRQIYVQVLADLEDL